MRWLVPSCLHVSNSERCGATEQGGGACAAACRVRSGGAGRAERFFLSAKPTKFFGDLCCGGGEFELGFTGLKKDGKDLRSVDGRNPYHPFLILSILVQMFAAVHLQYAQKTVDYPVPNTSTLANAELSS